MIVGLLKRFTKTGGLKELFLLYGVQLATFAIPILSVPYLARVLGVNAWGQVAAIQSLALFLSFLVEYGFSFSATRKLAAKRYESQNGDLEIYLAVQTAKALLSILYILCCTAVYFAFPALSSDGALFFWGMLSGLIQGWSPIWYFQGVGKLSLGAWIEIVGRLLGIFSIFFLVKGVHDGYKFFAAYSIFLGMAYFYLNLEIIERRIIKLPTPERVFGELKQGFSMFVFRAIGGLYTSANSAILRTLAPVSQVAYFGGSEKIYAGAKSSLLPINQLAFPRISFLVESNFVEARRFFWRLVALMLCISLFIVSLLWFVSPFLVGIILGREFDESIGVFRVMLLSFPLVALSNAFGMQWLLPNRLDGKFNLIIILAAIINITFMLLLVPKLGAIGAAYTMLISEGFVTAGFIFMSFKFSRLTFGGFR